MLSTPKKNIITVSSKAWNKINDVLKNNNHTAFLFSAKSGGCNGFNYNLQTIDKNEYNKLYKTKIQPTSIKNGKTKLIIDPSSEMLLIGTTIDYIKEDYSKNIFESKFIFIPQKEKADTCGCGVSFTPKSIF